MTDNRALEDLVNDDPENNRPSHEPIESSEELYRLAQTRDGKMLYNPRDVYIGASIERYGEFSYLEAELLVELCSPGDTVIDVGANIGAHTVALSKRVGPQGFVYAFEPQRPVFQVLCANIPLNALTNVECVHAVCGSTPGEDLLPDLRYDLPGNFGAFGEAFFGSGRRVRRVTLDDYAEAARIALVKIDVVGMESAVIAGAGNLISSHRPMLYVANDCREKSEALIAQIQGLEYRLYWSLPPLFNPNNWHGETADLWAGAVSVNMLCIPRECEVEFAADVREITLPLDEPQVQWNAALLA